MWITNSVSSVISPTVVNSNMSIHCSALLLLSSTPLKLPEFLWKSSVLVKLLKIHSFLDYFLLLSLHIEKRVPIMEWFWKMKRLNKI